LHLNILQVVPNFRVRTIPVLGTTPALFGQAAAAWVVTQLARQPFSPEPMFGCVLQIPAAHTVRLDLRSCSCLWLRFWCRHVSGICICRVKNCK